MCCNLLKLSFLRVHSISYALFLKNVGNLEKYEAIHIKHNEIVFYIKNDLIIFFEFVKILILLGEKI